MALYSSMLQFEHSFLITPSLIRLFTGLYADRLIFKSLSFMQLLNPESSMCLADMAIFSIGKLKPLLFYFEQVVLCLKFHEVDVVLIIVLRRPLTFPNWALIEISFSIKSLVLKLTFFRVLPHIGSKGVSE